jgi:hypothetical protein
MGTPKIADFGLAKRLDDAGLKTASGAVMGTPSYMAPEQAQGKQVGPLADVYALGAILYECLTGRPPFKGATTMDTLMLVVGNEPVPPRRLNPQVPRDLETICLKCLEKDPGKRYGTALALAEDLRRFQAHEPIAARPASALEKAVKWARRRPAQATAVAISVVAAAVLLVAGLVFLTELRAAWGEEKQRSAELGNALQKTKDAEAAEKKRSVELATALKKAETAEQEEKKRSQEKDEALKKAERLLGNSFILVAENAWNAPGQTAELVRHYLDQVPAPARAWEWEYLKRKCEGGLYTLYGHTGTVTSVAWSGDGSRPASASSDSTVRIWDAHSGQSLLHLKGHNHWVMSVAWSADGRRLATASGDQTVRIWDAHSGQSLLELKGHNKRVESVAWSDDGRRLVSNDESGTRIVWDAKTGESLPDAPIPPLADPRNVSPDGKCFAVGSGNVVVIVPTQLDEAERLRRQWLMRPDPEWHVQQRKQFLKEKNAYAAAYHASWEQHARGVLAFEAGDVARATAHFLAAAALKPKPPPAPDIKAPGK